LRSSNGIGLTMGNDLVRRPLASIAILFGTPLTQVEFDKRRVAGPPSDYIQNLEGRDGDPWNYYRQDADAGSQLLEGAKCDGARVYPAATLEHLREATAICGTVIILAHWRGASFRARDLLVAPEQLVAFIETSPDPIVQEFRGLWPDPVEIEKFFNAAIMGKTLLKYLPLGFCNSTMTDTLRFAVLRDLLDEALGENIAPGNRLELFDGLHAVDAVEDAIDSRFDGLLDLSMCHSNALAVFIDRRRQGRVKSFHWPVPIAPGPQYLMILDTLQELARDGESYMDLRMRRFEQLRSKGDDHVI
jgi:hypothetical protein